MSKVGNWGQILKFRVDDDRLLTFGDMNHSADVATAEHATIVGKQRIQFIAPNAETTTFTIELNASMYRKPIRVRSTIVDAMQKGLYAPLVVGGRLIMANALCTKVGTAYDVIVNRGRIYSLKLDITMREYS